MKWIFTLCLFWLCSFASYAHDGQIDFIQNQNQFPQPVRFKANLPGGAVFLRTDGFTYNYYQQSDIEHIHELRHQGQNELDAEIVHCHAYSVTFAQANPAAVMSSEGVRPYYHNYFLGNDPGRWAGHVPLFQTVQWKNIYTGINAVMYSKGPSLKYDFIIAPGADAAQVQLAFEGVKPLLQKDGSLLIRTSVNSIKEAAPYAYQLIDGKQVAVKCRYALLPGNKIGFAFPEGYAKDHELIIDPVLVFSTFSGSTVSTYGFSATYDLSGSLYAGGECFGVGWPVTTGAFQMTYGSGVDAGINKYNTNGTTLVYSTYYGGSGSDLPNNMIVNAQQQLIICGSTTSTNLPVSTGCFDNTFGGIRDIYVARFSADGSQLRAGTYLGGSDVDGGNIASLSPNYGDYNRGEVFTNASGNIYVASSSFSADFPVTTGAVQTTLGGAQDGVVCKLDSSLATLQYSTFLGGSGNDAAFSLVLNSSNEIVVCGGTASTNFPVTSGVLFASSQGGTDGFVSTINPVSGSSLVHSTYLGYANYDHAFKIQVDPLDNVLVMGQTTSPAFPVSTGVFSVTNGDIFIAKLNPALSSLLLSTRMGNALISPTANATFVPTAFLHDVCGNTYLSGFGASTYSPLSPSAWQTTPGSFWLGALSPGFTSLLYGTFFGPTGTHVDGGTSRFDPQGIIYHSACTADPNFPTSATAVHPVKLSGGFDIASYKFNMDVGGVTAAFSLANNANDTACAPFTVSFDNNSMGATSYTWYFGDGDSSILATPTHTFPEGSYTITLIAQTQTGCNLSDTATMNIFVKHTDKPLLVLNDTFICDPVPLTLAAHISNLTPAMGFHWEPLAGITSSPNQAQVIVDPSASTVYTVYVSNNTVGECVDTAMGSITISLYDYSHMTALPLDTFICPGDTLLMRAYGGTKYQWTPDYAIASTTTPFTLAWPGQGTVYKVKIENDSGCMIERAVNVNLYPPVQIDAGNDQDIKLGESTTLEGVAAGNYYWTPQGAVMPGSALNGAVAPDETTTYYLWVTSEAGCKVMDSVTIHVTNAFLPNAFSPNGDGINDVFRLAVKDERVKLKDFSVFNRYGQRVFFTRDVKEGWDGTQNGKKADLATYFYHIRYIIGEKTYTLKGDVTLIR